MLAESKARDAFKKEAILWVNLNRHPFILNARWVDVFSGRLFISMDYISPDSQGRVSLADHLAKSTRETMALGGIKAKLLPHWASEKKPSVAMSKH